MGYRHLFIMLASTAVLLVVIAIDVDLGASNDRATITGIVSGLAAAFTLLSIDLIVARK